MRKTKLLLAACAMMFGVSANAQIANGDYYIQNVSSGLYLCGTNNWGTRACVATEGALFTLTQSNGKYSILHTGVTASNKYLGSNLFTDSTDPGWTIKEVDGEPGVYTIAVDNYLAQSSEAGLYAGYVAVWAEEVSDASKWYIMNKEQAITKLKTATPTNPLTATFLIKNPGFNRNINLDSWTRVGVGNPSGGDDNFRCAERWHGTFEMSQILGDAPKGLYALSANGFYREDPESDGSAYPYFFANSKKGNFPLRTGTENDMTAAAKAFGAGKYCIDPIFVEVSADGDLTIGAKLESNNGLWTIWDNFQLTYYGDVTYAEAELIILKGQYQDKYNEAYALKSQPMNATVLDNLTTTLSTYETVAENKDDLEKAIADLTTVIGKANASVAAYASANIPAYLAQMDEGLLGANMYTPESYATYYENVEANYNAGLLSNEFASSLTANGAWSHGWHATNNLDDILLSSWTVGGEQCKDYDKALYINTWSVEGDTDGSAFYNPFYEYFVGDPNELGVNTFVSTVPGLEPNTNYAVTIRARVRRSQTDGIEVDPTAITMQVGSGDVAYLSSGEKFGETDFYIGNFAAVGMTDGSGNLVTTISVAANSGCHWLSFNTMKYQSMDELNEEFLLLQSEAEGLLADDNYSSITGSERTNLSAAKDAAPANFEELTAAINALKDALVVFAPAKDSYDALAAEVEKAKEIGMTKSDLAAFTASSAAEAAANVKNLKVAEFEFVETKYPYSVELGAWTASENTGTMTGQHWDGTSTSTYLEQSGGAWGSSSWDLSYTQNLTLPAGKYVFKVAGRHANSENVQLNLIVLDKEDDSTLGFIEEFPAGDVGLGINKEGKASFDPEDPAGFANDNKGRGFQWRYVGFELSEQRTVTLIVSASADAKYQWVSFCNASVQSQKELTKASMNIVAADQYATFIAPFAVAIPEGVTASKITGVESDGATLKLETVSTTIPANTPVIVNSAEAVNQTFIGANGATEDSYTAGLLTGVYVDTEAPDGSYVLQNQNKKVGFYKVNTEKATPKVKANRAYLVAPAAARVLYLDGVATSIMAVSNVVSGNAEIFNANGVRIQNLQKGLNIVKKDGQIRKIMVK